MTPDGNKRNFWPGDKPFCACSIANQNTVMVGVVDPVPLPALRLLPALPTMPVPVPTPNPLLNKSLLERRITPAVGNTAVPVLFESMLLSALMIPPFARSAALDTNWIVELLISATAPVCAFNPVASVRNEEVLIEANAVVVELLKLTPVPVAAPLAINPVIVVSRTTRLPFKAPVKAMLMPVENPMILQCSTTN